MSDHLSKKDVKEALKEAHKEWLDAHFAAFGRWTMMAIMGMFFAAFIQFLVWIRTPEKNESSSRPEATRIESTK